MINRTNNTAQNSHQTSPLIHDPGAPSATLLRSQPPQPALRRDGDHPMRDRFFRRGNVLGDPRDRLQRGAGVPRPSAPPGGVNIGACERSAALVIPGTSPETGDRSVAWWCRTASGTTLLCRKGSSIGNRATASPCISSRISFSIPAPGRCNGPGTNARTSPRA